MFGVPRSNPEFEEKCQNMLGKRGELLALYSGTHVQVLHTWTEDWCEPLLKRKENKGKINSEKKE